MLILFTRAFCTHFYLSLILMPTKKFLRFDGSLRGRGGGPGHSGELGKRFFGQCFQIHALFCRFSATSDLQPNFFGRIQILFIFIAFHPHIVFFCV